MQIRGDSVWSAPGARGGRGAQHRHSGRWRGAAEQSGRVSGLSLGRGPGWGWAAGGGRRAGVRTRGGPMRGTNICSSLPVSGFICSKPRWSMSGNLTSKGFSRSCSCSRSPSPQTPPSRGPCNKYPCPAVPGLASPPAATPGRGPHPAGLVHAAAARQARRRHRVGLGCCFRAAAGEATRAAPPRPRCRAGAAELTQ